ncbi:MAG: CD3072 family TudS-related putative desulfidase [Pleomorphochaeta sp.]
MKKIIFVSHCILNIASKVVMYNKEDMDKEESLRKLFLDKAIKNDIQIIQLPCPEFTMYGAKRWGHVSNQFDNIFFRNYCKKILEPIINQLIEYLNNPEMFKVLGIIGIDGSPSCGVDYTCYGNWYGSFEEREDLDETLNSCKMDKGKGVLFDVLTKMLEDENLLDKVKVTALFANEPQKCLSLLDE